VYIQHKSSVIHYLLGPRPYDSCCTREKSFSHSRSLYGGPTMPSTVTGVRDVKQAEVPALI
jgi:hypothetical protein